MRNTTAGVHCFDRRPARGDCPRKPTSPHSAISWARSKSGTSNLWFAGRRANWDLARYELAHIRTSLEDATLDRLEKSLDAAAALKGQQLEGDLKAAAEELTAKKAATNSKLSA
jgi:hypothetical protein